MNLQIEEDWFGRGTAFWGYGLWVISLLINFLTLLVLQLLLKKKLEQMVIHTYKNKAGLVAGGLIYLLGLPILAALCIGSVLGIPFGAMLLVLFVLSLWLGNCLAALLLTHYLNSRNQDSWSFWTIIFLSLAIVAITDLIVLFPVLGAIAYAALLVITYGIICHYIWDTSPQIRELIR